MTRNDAIALVTNCTINSYDYQNLKHAVDRIYDDFTEQICSNCKHDGYGCSVQDSILQVDPEATFTAFGCNSFESCK
jgi:hypothetical protein